MDGAEHFRQLALLLPGAHEGSHHGTADFRVDGRIFATLAYASRGQGVLKITPDQQAAFVAEDPAHFQPVPGGWGRMGMTLVMLHAPESLLAGALLTAHHHVVQTAAQRRRRQPLALTKT